MAPVARAAVFQRVNRYTAGLHFIFQFQYMISVHHTNITLSSLFIVKEATQLAPYLAWDCNGKRRKNDRREKKDQISPPFHELRAARRTSFGSFLVACHRVRFLFRVRRVEESCGFSRDFETTADAKFTPSALVPSCKNLSAPDMQPDIVTLLAL